MKKTMLHSICYCLCMSACVEPANLSSSDEVGDSSVGTLVVEASITDNVEIQWVFISRMLQIESDSTVNVAEDALFSANTPFIVENGLGTDVESNAIVEITDATGRMYRFQEVEPGSYASLQPFAAVAGSSYDLQVTTDDGERYNAATEAQTQTARIDRVYAERVVNGSGQEGIGIFIDATTDANENTQIRYSYEETYKIIAPNWTPLEFEIISEGNPAIGIPPVVTTVPRAQEERVCFRTDLSTTLLLNETDLLEGNTIERNRVRFLANDNPIIAHRYSILVKQSVLSQEAFGFYERLANFSSSENLFSQVQPGKIEGNVTNTTGADDVIGLFEVVSESSQRLFFNYTDFYPNEPLPPFFDTEFNCDRLLSPVLLDPELDGEIPPNGGCAQPLVERIKLGLIEYVSENDEPAICQGPYFVTPRICGDCTVIGSNAVPDFWVE